MLRAGQREAAGRKLGFSLTWDGRSGGTRLAPGVYLVRFRAPDRVVTRRFVLMR